MMYFKLYEFDQKGMPGTGRNMNPVFLSRLDNARGIAGMPFIISSAWRSDSYNESVGGVKGSAHTKGLAVDISCKNSKARFLIVKALIESGFTRIGIAKTFIHVDMDGTKPKNVIWTY